MRDQKLSLLIRNLRFTTSPQRVRQFFEQFGEVRDVYLPLDYHTKLPRGFGFVEFARDEDAEAALDSLSRNAVLDGAEVSVTVAQQGRKSPDTMRHREGDEQPVGVRRRGGDDSRRGGGGDYRRGDVYRRSRSRSDCRDRGGRYRSRSRSYGRYDRRRDDRYNHHEDRYHRGGGAPGGSRYNNRYNGDDFRGGNHYNRRRTDDGGYPHQRAPYDDGGRKDRERDPRRERSQPHDDHRAESPPPHMNGDDHHQHLDEIPTTVVPQHDNRSRSRSRSVEERDTHDQSRSQSPDVE